MTASSDVNADIASSLDEELARLQQERLDRICRRRQERAEHQQARRYGLTARHRRRLALLACRGTRQAGTP